MKPFKSPLPPPKKTDTDETFFAPPPPQKKSSWMGPKLNPKNTYGLKVQNHGVAPASTTG